MIINGSIGQKLTNEIASYKIIGYLENYRNNESMTANVVNKVEIP